MRELLEWRKLSIVSYRWEWKNFLDTPITEEELKAAMRKGVCNKASGRDSIYLGFFKVNWDSIRTTVA